jgi:MoaA/NifB/PqqE/SkfB family radical SAM enzyme
MMINAGVMAVAIHVDGVDAATHDSLRGVSGAKGRGIPRFQDNDYSLPA